MSLSNKQKKFIEKNWKKYSTEKFVKEFNLDKSEVEEYLIKLKEAHKPAPKIFYVILILIPILFFILLEVGLRLFNYGYNLDQWVEVTPTSLALNPEIGKRYFYTTQTIPESIQDIFDKEKSPNSFRVFVLGGSSAAGYPYMPLGSFSRYIRQRLEHTYPQTKIEVINIGLTAVNSFTIRDFIPGVIEQKPDLVIIYAGHNEYYGALGVGSMESLGKSRSFINMVLYLNKYKITQLVRDFISWFSTQIASDTESKTGTLMSRMAMDQEIILNSEIYELGIEQFDGNISECLEMLGKTNVNVIIGTLVSNLSDQPPFISKTVADLPSANEVFSKAKNSLNNGLIEEADSLFRYAKDLDLLRFRAPEKINKIISSFVGRYNIPVVNLDSVFSKYDPVGIIGDNLMTDHLHPTLEGYLLMGKSFYNAMVEKKYLPGDSPSITNLDKQDSITVADYRFSKLDSVIADYKIKQLKNDWPFINRQNKLSNEKLLMPKTYIDSLAYQYLTDKKAWLDIQREAASYYLKTDQINLFIKQMKVLTHQYPVLYELNNSAANNLLQRGFTDEAFYFVSRRYKLSPDAFSSKWFGIILLSKGSYTDAMNYLEESLRYNSKDEQVLYNLAGAYSQIKKYNTALEKVKLALLIKPDYEAAIHLKSQLEKVVK
ncbi:hypothetical protein ASZ90_003712 [hydrocarbon metagenome]|uniref:Uncharacterized protein n=1 Tax=hydrocarbon metagenome TaxID=938273 RepID=A0A0W8FZX1_9ZZZZ